MRQTRCIGSVVLVTSLAVAALVPAIGRSADVAFAAAGSVAGKVFDDKDMNGSMNGTEAGVQGVTVSAYDATGTSVGTTTTGAGGTYTLTVASASTTAVRVEFTTPVGYEPSMVGTGNATSIQFVTLGATNVDYAVQIPAAYCDNNNATMSLAAACIRPGTTSGSASSVGSVSSIGWTSRTAGTMTNFSNTGAIWGLGSDRTRGALWASAVVRRHAGLGPAGLGGLYVLRQSSTAGVVASFDLTAAPYNLAFAATPGSFTDAARGITNSSLLSLDAAGYSGVGRAGIGDIDVSTDGQYLFVTNLHTRQIHRFALGGTAAAPTLGALTTYDLPSSACPGTTARPWALNATAQAGHVLVGVVCTGEEGAFSATSDADGGRILDLDTASSTWSTKATVDFGYPRGFERCTASTGIGGEPRRCEPVQWHDWTDDFASIRAARVAGTLESVTEGGEDLFWFSQPMIVDIENLVDGSLVIGISDRFNYQIGSANIAPDETNVNSPTFNYLTSRVAGDVLLLCATGSGLAQEFDGSCAGSTTYTGATRPYSTVGLASEVGYREFFDDNVGGTFAGAHQEIAIGGLAVYPSSGTQLIALSAMDADNNLNSNGVRWLNLTDGSMNGSGVRLTSGDVDSFEKSVSMGDLELICDAAPLQIGNRIWYDMNRNGIQDAGEGPAVGVVVELYTTGGTKRGTAVTDANGTYYFTSTLSESAGGNGDNRGGGLAAYTSYEIRVGSFSNYTGGSSAPLDYTKWQWTTSNATDAATLLDDAVDSDATLTNVSGLFNQARYTTSPLAPGQVNHTFDFGVAPRPASVGSRVWYEVPNDFGDDGTQNDIDSSGSAAEAPAVGVTVRLTDVDGNPVTDANGNVVGPKVTDSSGNYLFSNLPPGQAYRVSIEYPSGFGPAPLANPDWYDRTVDTSSWSEVTDVLDPGEADLTLDFGMVPAVEVGDFVWIDTDQDGIQDAGEPGLAGVTITLTDPRGNPVVDTSGLPVGPRTTDADGRYLFNGLPSGTYNARITYPAGYGPTKVEQGADVAVDSSGRVAVSMALVAGNSSLDADMRLDFGVVPMQTQPVAVGDLVWNDLDGDGLQDANEPGVAGVTVTLTDTNGTAVRDRWGVVVAPKQTGPTGQYLFDGLNPGTYKVWVTYPDGYGPTTGGAGSDGAVDSSTSVATSVTLAGGQADLTLDFGIRQGVPTPPPPTTNPPPTTSTPTTSTPTTSTPTTSTSTTSTPGSGPTPTSPTPGLSESGSSVRPGYPGTFEGGSGHGSGANDTPVWNGSDLAPSSIGVNVGGYVWLDGRQDGRQEGSERGLTGVILSLVDGAGNPARDVDGNIVPDTVTDPTGHYLFPRLAPGTYRVVIREPAGYEPTVPGSGTWIGDSSSGSALSLQLTGDGDFDLTLDFGFVPVTGLPRTGADPWRAVPFAVVLFAAGVVALVLDRRLRSER